MPKIIPAPGGGGGTPAPAQITNASRWSPIYRSTTDVKTDEPIVAPFAGNVQFYVHHELVAPSGGTALLTVTNRTGSVVMVSSVDVVPGITTSPTTVTMTNTAVAALDALEVKLTYDGSISPDANVDGIAQATICVTAQFTRS